jgi:glycosyl transferase family 92
MSTRYLSLCAVFKWEWPWLQEWVIYHQLVGVEHFYLYCNEEGDDMARSREILAPFIRQGTATFMQLPGKTFQLAAYNHAIRASRGQTRWLAAIDLDEFLYPVATETVPEVLKDFEDCPAVAFNWQCFGSSGHLQRPKSQLRDFVRRAAHEWEGNTHYKSIIDPAAVDWFDNPHNARVATVDENHKPVAGLRKDFTGRRLLVNHYVVRSRQDFEEGKLVRGRADQEVNDRDWAFFGVHDRNEVFDDSIARRFADRVDQQRAKLAANADRGE